MVNLAVAIICVVRYFINMWTDTGERKDASSEYRIAKNRMYVHGIFSSYFWLGGYWIITNLEV